MKDIKIAKDKVTCDFEEAENFENIQSGESIGTIFGKVQRWFNNLKGTPKRYYSSNGELGGVDLTPDSENVPSGKNSVTSGSKNTVISPSSVAMGESNEVHSQYSFAAGYGNVINTATDYSIAMGKENKVNIGKGAVALGHLNTTGNYSIAIGTSNEANGVYSVAIGSHCVSDTGYSIALGTYLTASGTCQTVLGRYNIPEDGAKYALIIGNGTAPGAGQSNALTLDWDGNLWTAGDVTATDSDGNNVSLCEIKAMMENILERIEKLESISEITNEKIDEIMEG